MKRLDVVYGEMSLEDALVCPAKRWTYCYDPVTINPQPGNIIQVRANGELTTATVVQLGSSWKGAASPILRILAPALPVEANPESPEPQMGDQMQVAQEAELPKTTPAKPPRKLVRISLMQQVGVIHMLNELRMAGKKFESDQALAETIAKQSGFAFTKNNLEHIAKELLDAPAVQGGFDVMATLVVQKSAKLKSESMKTRLEALEDAMHDTMLELAQARAMIEALQQRIDKD